MADVELFIRDSGDTTQDGIANYPDWTGSGPVLSLVSNDFSSIKIQVKLSKLGSQPGNLNLHFMCQSGVNEEAIFLDLTTIPNDGVPRWYEKELVNGPYEIYGNLTVNLQVQTETTEYIDWRRTSDPLGFMMRIYGVRSLPNKAQDPVPEHEATEVDFSSRTIMWTDGGYADTFNVYIGDAADNLTLVSAAQEDSEYILSDADMALWPEGTCYWRIDSINEIGTTTGNVWNFTIIVVGVEIFRFFSGTTKAVMGVDLAGHRVRASKNDIIYGIPLVAIDDPSASPIRIFDGESVKAFTKWEI